MVWRASMVVGLTLLAPMVQALNVLNEQQKQSAGVTFMWVQKIPEQAVAGKTYTVSFDIKGGGRIDHLNLHACPAPYQDGLCSKKQGRQDGPTLKGESNKRYSEPFTFDPAKTKFDREGKAVFYVVGHAVIDLGGKDADNIVTTNVIKVTVSKP